MPSAASVTQTPQPNIATRRAAELGQVEEVHEEQNGSITIKVRV